MNTLGWEAVPELIPVGTTTIRSPVASDRYDTIEKFLCRDCGSQVLETAAHIGFHLRIAEIELRAGK